MRRGRPTPALTIAPDERETLVRWSRPPKTARALAQRAPSFWPVRPERQIRRSARRSHREMEEANQEYVRSDNRHPKPFVWTKTADEILASLPRFCQRISSSGH